MFTITVLVHLLTNTLEVGTQVFLTYYCSSGDAHNYQP